jgi:hypothetical protein
MNKTNDEKHFENFPWWIVLLSNVFSILIYATGAFILAGFGIVTSFLYLLYCFFIEMTLLRRSCVNCYYYDKYCGLGKGKLCSLFFKKGDPQKFADKEISWIKMLPDFLVFIFPLIGGIVLLIQNFFWIILALLLFLIFLFCFGNNFIRGSLVCKYCKQMEHGCPAEKFFNKETQS